MGKKSHEVLFAWSAIAFVIAGLLGAFSLVSYEFGLSRIQVAIAGVAELLLSLFFVAAGGALVIVSARSLWGRESIIARLVFAGSALLTGVCWLVIGIKGIVSMDLLIATYKQG